MVHKHNQSGFIHIVLIIIIVIIGVLLLVGAFSSDDKDQHGSIIQVDGLKGAATIISDSNYTLNFEAKGTASRLTDVNVTANGGQIQKPIRQYGTQSSKDASYKITPLTGLRFGENKVLITVTETTGSKKELDKKEFRLSLVSTAKPELAIDKAQPEGANQTIKVVSDKEYSIFIDTRAKGSTTIGASSVTVNGKPAEFGTVAGYFSFRTPISEGSNPFTIVAKNSLGEVSSQLVIQKPTQSELAQQGALINAIVEGEVYCKKYAEDYFKVKDINISKNESSVEKQNPDGTVLIKVQIADSRGVLKQEKPLGTMECTTDSSGTKVIQFLHY